MRILLDPGHGKETPGKRSPLKGIELFEWEFNRDIVRRLMEWGPRYGLDCVNLVPEYTDVSLVERVRRAHLYGNNSLYVSIHANAGGGSGCEVFTSPGQTASDPYATIFYDSLKEAFPQTKRADMSDGDPDKEARFYVLVNTTMPAVLLELFFMDNRKDVMTYLLTESGRTRTTMALLAALVKINRGR